MGITDGTISSCLSAKFSILHNRGLFKTMAGVLMSNTSFHKRRIEHKIWSNSPHIVQNPEHWYTFVHTADDLFKKGRHDLSLQDEMKILHNAIPIFKRPLKYSTWFYDIRMNVEEKVKIVKVQMSFRLLPLFSSWNHYSFKNNQVN